MQKHACGLSNMINSATLMVNITLSNFNRNSSYKKAIINLTTGICVVDGQAVEARLLADTMDFSHPLLTQSILYSSDGCYIYEYDDFDGLLDVAKFIYATLLHVNNPLDCKFNITPSANFVRTKEQYEVFFSMDYKKQATETIGIQQLNALISHFHGFNFLYQDTIVIDQLITLKDLPSDVDGDLICQTNMDVMQYCKQVDDFTQYELRYINRFIGFGVFARNNIAQGKKITVYCGIKNYTNDNGGPYVFGYKDDVFKLRINAMYFGNISRFINHAPQNASVLAHKRSSEIKESNIVGEKHGLYGNDVVLYTATKTILKGEQLLMNYGDKYYFDKPPVFFRKSNGNVLDLDNKMIKESRYHKHQMLSMLSQHGIKQAQWALVRKPLIVLMITLFVTIYHTKNCWQG